MSYLQLNGYAHEQSHIRRQLFVDHVVAFAPMRKKENSVPSNENRVKGCTNDDSYAGDIADNEE